MTLAADGTRRLLQGQRIRLEDLGVAQAFADGETVRVYDEGGRLLGVGVINSGVLAPKRLLAGGEAV